MMLVLLLLSVLVLVEAQYGGYYGNYGNYGNPNYLNNQLGLPMLGYGQPLMSATPFGGSNGVNCVDTNAQCAMWASTGQCATNPLMMRTQCALSCGMCASTLGMGIGGLTPTLGMSPTLGMTPTLGMGYPTLGLGIPQTMGLGLNNYGGMSNYGSYGINPFMGRSIYETDLLQQPSKSGLSGLLTGTKPIGKRFF